MVTRNVTCEIIINGPSRKQARLEFLTTYKVHVLCIQHCFLCVNKQWTQWLLAKAAPGTIQLRLHIQCAFVRIYMANGTLLIANLRNVNSFSLLADLNTWTAPGFLTMLDLKYNNGSTGIATTESSNYRKFPFWTANIQLVDQLLYSIIPTALHRSTFCCWDQLTGDSPWMGQNSGNSGTANGLFQHVGSGGCSDSWNV